VRAKTSGLRGQSQNFNDDELSMGKGLIKDRGRTGEAEEEFPEEYFGEL
jgi:hypothetical protein